VTGPGGAGTSRSVNPLPGEPRRRDITLTDGRRMEAAWWGPPPDAAPTIVLLHEGLGCVALWRDFPPRVAAATGCGVFAWSRLGYGRSDPVPLPRPLTYMHDEAREVLPRILDAAGVRRCVLLGHSDGASIAAIYAGSRQDFRLRGLVLLAAHFFVEPVGVAAIAEAKRRYAETDLRARLARHHDRVDIAFRGWNEAWLDPRFPEVFDLRDELAHIRVPMLLVQGEADPYGTIEQVRVAEREAYCPVETLLLPGVGHAPQFEAAEATLTAVQDFVAQVFKVQERARGGRTAS
jgi:pimeloyl-ACP methyl ester carboxylesterase